MSEFKKHERVDVIDVRDGKTVLMYGEIVNPNPYPGYATVRKTAGFNRGMTFSVANVALKRSKDQ